MKPIPDKPNPVYASLTGPDARRSDMDDLAHRFAYHPPKDDETRRAHEQVRAVVRGAAEAVVNLCPQGREQSLAITKLEEAMMWANAAIARAE